MRARWDAWRGFEILESRFVQTSLPDWLEECGRTSGWYERVGLTTTLRHQRDVDSQTLIVFMAKCIRDRSIGWPTVDAAKAKMGEGIQNRNVIGCARKQGWRNVLSGIDATYDGAAVVGAAQGLWNATGPKEKG